MPSCVGLVPARSGSKRVPGKNVRPLNGHPLLAYTIQPALASGVFSTVVVSTDSDATAAIARHYGAEAPFPRPAEMSGDLSPDIQWIEYTLRKLLERGRPYDCFSILRPTSPFRTPSIIRRAWDRFLSVRNADSIRAIEKCRHHPGKMWILDGDFMRPVMSGKPDEIPWHSRPYQDLPPVYQQNASLEIAWSRVALEGRTIAGNAILPFVTDGMEGFDINGPQDWIVAEHLIRTGEARLPEIQVAPWRENS